MSTLFLVYAIIFGALIGSFLNVVIYRLPLGKSLFSPRSACPSCNTMVTWWQNIPLLSFILLRGKCFQCKAPISWQYPLVELITAAVAGLLFPSEINGSTLFNWFFHFSIFCVLFCHLVIDLKHKLLLDILNIYLLAFILPLVTIFHPATEWLLGGAIGFLGPLGVSWAFYKLKNQVGLGGGDIKLWGVLGLYLGVHGIVMNIFLSCFLGSLVALVLLATKRINRETAIPFGPFIIIVALVQIHFSHLLTDFSGLLFR